MLGFLTHIYDNVFFLLYYHQLNQVFFLSIIPIGSSGDVYIFINC